MKKAFFAGALVVIRSAKTISEDSIMEDEAIKYLEDTYNEAVAFHRDSIRSDARKN